MGERESAFIQKRCLGVAACVLRYKRVFVGERAGTYGCHGTLGDCEGSGDVAVFLRGGYGAECRVPRRFRGGCR